MSQPSIILSGDINQNVSSPFSSKSSRASTLLTLSPFLLDSIQKRGAIETFQKRFVRLPSDENRRIKSIRSIPRYSRFGIVMQIERFAL